MKEVGMTKNKTVWGVVGIILLLFGMIGSFVFMINGADNGLSVVFGIAVIIGVIILAWISK